MDLSQFSHQLSNFPSWFNEISINEFINDEQELKRLRYECTKHFTKGIMSLQTSIINNHHDINPPHPRLNCQCPHCAGFWRLESQNVKGYKLKTIVIIANELKDLFYEVYFRMNDGIIINVNDFDPLEHQYPQNIIVKGKYCGKNID